MLSLPKDFIRDFKKACMECNESVDYYRDNAHYLVSSCCNKRIREYHSMLLNIDLIVRTYCPKCKRSIDCNLIDIDRFESRLLTHTYKDVVYHKGMNVLVTFGATATQEEWDKRDD